MLDAFIIEQIKRREEQERERDRRQPALEIPSRFPMQRPPGWSDADRRDRDRDAEEESDRGFVILDM